MLFNSEIEPEPSTQRVLTRLDQIHTLPLEESKAALLQLFEDLQQIASVETFSEIERFEANILLANILATHAPHQNHEQLDYAIVCLRTAFNNWSAFSPKDPDGFGLAGIASNLGGLLSGQASRVAPEQVESTRVDAEKFLRLALRSTGSTDPFFPSRTVLLVSHLLSLEDNRERLEESVQLLDTVQLDMLSPGQQTSAHLLFADAKRRLAFLETEENAALASEYFDQASSHIDDAKEVALDNGDNLHSTASYEAELAFSKYSFSNDPQFLDDAIDIGRIHERSLAADDMERPDAEMSLAEYLRTRYLATRNESDLEEAVELSSNAVNSYYLLPGSTQQLGLKSRRIPILNSTLTAPGSWRSEITEFHDRLREQGEEDAPSLKFLELEKQFTDLRSSLPQSLSSIVDCLNKLKDLVTQSRFPDGEQGNWVARYCELELQLLHSQKYQQADPDLSRGSIAAALLKRTTNASDPAATRHYHFLTITKMLTEYTIADPNNHDLGEAHATAVEALEIANNSADEVPVENVLCAAKYVRRLAHYMGRADQYEGSVQAVKKAANALPSESRPKDILLLYPRLRKSAAATAISRSDSLEEAVWTQHCLTSGLSVNDSQNRQAFRETIIRDSFQKTLVFLSLDYVESKAIVISESQWKKIPLPELAMDRMASILSNAHRLHHESGKSEKYGPDWRRARTHLEEKTSEALKPLAEALPGHTPSEIAVAGLGHTLPLLPLLSRLSDYDIPMSFVVPVKVEPVGEPKDHIQEFGVICSPGIGDDYLPNPIDDCEEALKLFPNTPQTVDLTSTTEEAIDILTSSQMVLLAGHSEADRADPALSAFRLQTERLRVDTILDTNLSQLDLAVFASCESSYLDPQIHENLLSLSAATLHAGASTTIGSHWRVGDNAAQAFTLALLKHVVEGENIPTAYIKAADTNFTLYQKRSIN